jgi:flagellar biosynthesis/type III secretory pathway protein FliH
MESEEAPSVGETAVAPVRRGRTRAILAGVAVVVCALAVGVAAYFVGKSTGEDLEAAQTAGARAGERAGTAKGTKQGYAAGFAQGRKKGYERAYAPAYRAVYTETLDDAGYEATEKELASLPTEP